jgi:serine/threonine protein kinase
VTLPQHKPLAPGTVVAGRFTLIERLAEGGFAVVYRAVDGTSGATCALKVLRPPQHSDAQAAFEQRFTREAEVASLVVHPNVVAIHGYAITRGVPWIAMELLEGHDLKTELRQNGAMEGARILPLFAQVLEGLDRGHAQGIVHRDLKPGNLFLRHQGTPDEALVLLDFGIARPTQDGDENLTATGHLLGTPRYYAPEYATKQLVTPALDVYQMGLILLEALKGSPAVPHSDPYTCLLAHCQGHLDFPESLRSSDLGDVIAGAIAVRHQERHPTAGAFARALRALDTRYIPSIEIALAPSALAQSALTVESRNRRPTWGDSLSLDEPWTPRLATLDTISVSPGAMEEDLARSTPAEPINVDSTVVTAPTVPCPLCLTPVCLTGRRVLDCPRCRFRFDVPDPEELQPAWVSDLPLPVGFVPGTPPRAGRNPGLGDARIVTLEEEPVPEPVEPVVEFMEPVVEFLEPVVEFLEPVVEFLEPTVEPGGLPMPPAAQRAPRAVKPFEVPDLDTSDLVLQPMESMPSMPVATLAPLPEESSAGHGNLGQKIRRRRRRSSLLTFLFLVLVVAGGYSAYRVATGGVAALKGDVARAGGWVEAQYDGYLAPRLGAKPRR